MEFYIDTTGKTKEQQTKCNKIKEIIAEYKESVEKQDVLLSKKPTLFEAFDEQIGWNKARLGRNTLKINEDDVVPTKKHVNELLKKSVVTSQFEQLHSVPQYEVAEKHKKLQRKKEAMKTKGNKWYGLPATEVTKDIKQDLQVLQMRSALDPKWFYKKNDLKVLPKYFQVGKVVNSPLDYYNGRLTKKESKKTLLKMVGEEKEWAEENYEHLIKSFIEDGNEVAVEYLLDNLSKLERKPQINFVALAVTAASTSSLSRFYTYYTPVLLKLLGKMNSQERDRLYKERPYDVLTHLMNLKLERCDEMMEDVWKTRPPQPVCQTLLADIANQAAEGNSDSLQTFMEFWKKINETNEEIDRIGEQLLPYLFQFDEKEIREILDGATDNEKKKVVEYVKSDEGLTPEYCKPWLLNLVVTSCLGSGNEEGKKFMEDLISSGKGLEICTYLISNGKFEEFKKFFDTANGSDKFKKRLFTMRGNDIFVSLCMTKSKSIFDQFLSWYFCDENRESKFKQNLVLSGIGIEVIINTVLRSSGSNCTWKKVYQDKFIEWGGLKESEFMIKFQGEQRESMRRRNICVNLLFEQSSELVNEFLNCCFPDDGEKIDEFKKDFISGDKAVNFCVNKIEAEKLYAVKNFLDWIDLPEEEREKLLSMCKALLPGRHKDVETAFAKDNSEALLAEQECEKTEDYSNNNKKKRQRVSAGNTEPKGKRFVQSNSPESSMEEMKVEVALCQEMVDELLLADADFNKYNKRKYKEIIEEKQKTNYKAWKQGKQTKRKSKRKKLV